MSNAKLFVLTEVSEFMMSYVIYTDRGNVIIVDGGRPEDVPELREKVKGRRIVAWFLTHPHYDHVSAFNALVAAHDPDFDFDGVYYNFPSQEAVRTMNDDDGESLPNFLALLPAIGDRAHVVHTGDEFTFDNVKVEVLYHYDEKDEKYRFIYPTVNDTSIAFRLSTPDKSVMFLGDLGPEAGEVLAEVGEEKLHADYCQMAHHGHAGVGADVYILINPSVCIWNARDWLYEEPGVLVDYRRYGVKRTRLWMERLGVKTNVVTKDGTGELPL